MGSPGAGAEQVAARRGEGRRDRDASGGDARGDYGPRAEQPEDEVGEEAGPAAKKLTAQVVEYDPPIYVRWGGSVRLQFRGALVNFMLGDAERW